MITKIIEESYDFWSVKGGPGTQSKAEDYIEYNRKLINAFSDNNKTSYALKALGSSFLDTPYAQHAAGLGGIGGAAIGGTIGLGAGVIGSLLGDNDSILGDIGAGMGVGGLIGASTGGIYGVMSSPNTMKHLAKAGKDAAVDEIAEKVKKFF